MYQGKHGVMFLPPAGFEDRTYYSFSEPTGREFAGVDYGKVSNAADTAWQMLDERAGQLEFLKKDDPSLAIEPAVNVQVGRLSGKMLSFVAHEGNYAFRVWWAIALPDLTTYVQVLYQASALDLAARDRVRHMLGSVTFAVEGSGGVPRDHFTRRRAGRIFLDVPVHLEAPSTFRFVAGEDDEIRLDVMIRDRPTTRAATPGEISQRRVESTRYGAQPATVTRFVLTRNVFNERKRTANIQCHLDYANGVFVEIDGTAPVELGGMLEAAFDALVRSIGKAA